MMPIVKYACDNEMINFKGPPPPFWDGIPIINYIFISAHTGRYTVRSAIICLITMSRLEKNYFDNSGPTIQKTDFAPPPESPPETLADQYPRTIRALQQPRQQRDNHSRTIVICLDGTGDRFDNDNSSVVHFVSCLKKHATEEQVTYYQSGIGTYDRGGLKNGVSAAVDMAVGSGLGIHIKDAYKFLMQNYEDGDRICLLGFSRGAYTARCLAGMLHKVGLLPASNGAQVNFAYDFYKDDSVKGWDMSSEFKRTFCTDVDVYFLGLWDCVASVGLIPRKLPFSKSPTNSIHYFRHAMALDEHRAKFKVCQWLHQDPDLTPEELERRRSVDDTPMGQLKRTGIFDCFRPRDENGNKISRGQKTAQQQALEAKFEAQEEANRRRKKVNTDSLEVWFMGAHADVGGGSAKNEDRHMLARIPLRWMIRQCFECNTGILFKTERLAEHGLDVHSLYPVYEARTRPTTVPPPALMNKYEQGILAPIRRRSTFLRLGPAAETIQDAPTEEDLSYILPSEADEDYFDSRAEPHDQLKDSRGWWILEFWPVKVRVLGKDGDQWVKKVRFNMGRYRAVRESEPKLHWTVQHMIDNDKYETNTRMEKNAEWQEVA